MTEIRPRPLTDGGGDLLHGVIALGEGHDLAALEQGKQDSQDGARDAQPEKIFCHG